MMKKIYAISLMIALMNVANVNAVSQEFSSYKASKDFINVLHEVLAEKVKTDAFAPEEAERVLKDVNIQCFDCPKNSLSDSSLIISCMNFHAMMQIVKDPSDLELRSGVQLSKDSSERDYFRDYCAFTTILFLPLGIPSYPNSLKESTCCAEKLYQAMYGVSINEAVASSGLAELFELNTSEQK